MDDLGERAAIYAGIKFVYISLGEREYKIILPKNNFLSNQKNNYFILLTKKIYFVTKVNYFTHKINILPKK